MTKSEEKENKVKKAKKVNKKRHVACPVKNTR